MAPNQAPTFLKRPFLDLVPFFIFLFILYFLTHGCQLIADLQMSIARYMLKKHVFPHQGTDPMIQRTSVGTYCSPLYSTT